MLWALRQPARNAKDLTRSGHELVQDMVRVDAKCPSQVDEFYDIDAPFADFDSRYDCLGSFEACRQLVLR